MAYEPDIIKSMNYIFGESFSRLVEEHHYLPAIWEHCSDPDMMLEMLRHSNYRQDYFDELCEFDRWLSNERKKRERDLGDFDKYISYNKAKFESEISKGQLSSDRLEQCIWDAAFMYAHVSVNKMTNDAVVGAIWDNILSKPDEETWERMKVEIREQSGKEQSQKLRELIPNPFLPNIK